MQLLNTQTLKKIRLILGLSAFLILSMRFLFPWDKTVPAFFYFTVLSNMFCAAHWIYRGLFSKEQTFYALKKLGLNVATIDHFITKRASLIHAGITLYMLITGIVFSTIIDAAFSAKLSEALISGQIDSFVHSVSLICSAFTHYIFPILIVADFILFGHHRDWISSDYLQILSFPIIYGLFHSIHGAITGKYMYPFLSPLVLGNWFLVFLVIIALSLLFVLTAHGMFALKRKIGHQLNKAFSSSKSIA